MKKASFVLPVSMAAVLVLAGCGSDETPEESQPAVATESESADVESPSAEESDDSTAAPSAPEGDIVDGALATIDTPVPLGSWASVTVSDGGYPTPAYVRVSNVVTDQTQVQARIDEYNGANLGDEIPSLEEHAEFLDYVAVEYEVFFPADFTDSEHISFSGLAFSRENKQDNDWIASDGSNYYWMGAVTTIDAPSRETGYPENGDTVTCTIVYPMIKGNADYTLHYKERTEDLSADVETYFAVK